MEIIKGMVGLDCSWEVSRESGGVARIAITEGEERRNKLPSELEERGDDPLLYWYLLPEGTADHVVIATIVAMREAVIGLSRKWSRKTPWPDVPKPTLPEGVAPFPVYWGSVGAALVPDKAARLEASGVVRRVANAAESVPEGHPCPYVLELDWTHHFDVAGRMLCIFSAYAGDEARAQLCAWMDWNEQWRTWVEEMERHAQHVAGTPSVFDVEW